VQGHVRSFPYEETGIADTHRIAIDRLGFLDIVAAKSALVERCVEVGMRSTADNIPIPSLLIGRNCRCEHNGPGR
jgi:hypothetical protein